MLATDHGHKAFLDARKQQSPVASREAFVGRRRELQTCLSVLRKGERAGLLIHGLGRLGKSSLAARLCHRRQDLAPVVIFGRYDAFSIANAICEACAPAQNIIEEKRAALRDNPDMLGDVLRGVLEGPCAQRVEGQQPILLVIDDLERILKEPTDGGPAWQVQPTYVPVLRSVIKAFRRAHTTSRLILTNRYKFTLPDGSIDLAEELFAFQLPPMDEASARKQALRRERAQKWEEIDLDEERQEAEKRRQAQFSRCIELGCGNPGLQDLLFDLVLQSPDVAEKAIGEMAAFLSHGEQPEEERVQAFLENLLLDELITIARADGQALLRALTVFELPVPLEVANVLAKAVGGESDRLLGLGLCDRFEDLVRPPRPAVAVNALVRPKIAALQDIETEALAKQALGSLFEQWGGVHLESRPPLANVELTRLALIAENEAVLTACGSDALAWLDWQFEYGQAADWGPRAVQILDSAGVEPPTGLLRRAGEACVVVGEAETALELYGRALVQIDQAEGKNIEPFEHAALLTSQGRLMIYQGELDRAVGLFEKAREIETARGHDGNVAVLSGEIADILQARGELEEALRIRREDELPVYERLGDVRSKAVTMGKIADILQARGELEEALALLQQSLEITRGLRYRDGIAFALWKIAQIELSRGDVNEAAPKIFEAYTLVDQMGLLEGIAAIGVVHEQLLIAANGRDGGLAVLGRSEAGFRKLGQEGMADKVTEVISKIEGGGP
jgi:tetratricopeptide (TPR) repeat protein